METQVPEFLMNSCTPTLDSLLRAAVTLVAMLKNDFREQGIHKQRELLGGYCIIQVRSDGGSDKGMVRLWTYFEGTDNKIS